MPWSRDIDIIWLSIFIGVIIPYKRFVKPKKTTSDTICFIAHVGLKEGEAIGEESVKVQAYLYRAVVSD